jgi:hypothetical protein
MNKNGPLVFGAFFSLALLFYVVVIRLGFVALPVFFLVLGFASYAWNPRKALILFLFALPLVGATPDLFFNGYPFNTMGIPLFYLSGILCASQWKGESPQFVFPGRGLYLLFLTLLGISAFFVYLRWANLGLAALAVLRDTPVAPSLERVSFACLFPAITLALFSLSPFLAFLLRRHLAESEIFVPLKAGFFLSFLSALAQKWIDPGFMSQSWWVRKMSQVNGGFSDFNAFGFFAGAMFLYQALKLIERWPLKRDRGAAAGAHEGSWLRWVLDGRSVAAELVFLAVSLAAVFVSGCRTAFLFILAAALRFLFAKKPGRLFKAAASLLLAAALLVTGGTLGKRLWRTATQAAQLTASIDFFQAADRISSGRLAMLRDGARMVGRFPANGVGAGNFLFYLKYLRFGKDAWLDLPLNQYLLFFSETGLPGGLAFLLFLAVLLRRQSSGPVRYILAAMTVALFFNNFFWFPEVLLLFWVFVARVEAIAAAASKKNLAWGAVVAMAFIAMNIVNFRPLHPATWARETATPYDYGFSYPENEDGRSFRWSGEKAGRYLHLDRQGRGAEFELTCGAPLARLPGQRQIVDVFWRGELLRRVVFSGNTVHRFRVEDSARRDGFLEFRVRPVFNLMRMGLAAESRDLGVQVSGPGL